MMIPTTVRPAIVLSVLSAGAATVSSSQSPLEIISLSPAVVVASEVPLSSRPWSEFADGRLLSGGPDVIAVIDPAPLRGALVAVPLS